MELSIKDTLMGDKKTREIILNGDRIRKIEAKTFSRQSDDFSEDQTIIVVHMAKK